MKNYPSQLQITSYNLNLSSTATTGELYAGVVKEAEKNPAQHNADIEMLQEAGLPKQIECIHVDGSVDEGPSHI